MLLVDIGNTRIKWAPIVERQLGTQRASSYAGWGSDELTAHLLSTSPEPKRIVVANVGGDAIARALTESTLAKWSIAPEFVCSSAAAGGVRNSYPKPEQLGVDRWLCMIAARQLQAAAACIVSVGTAMTVDAMDRHGQHLGGIIVPGPDLSISSLLKGTSDLAPRSQVGTVHSKLFADNTLGAIHQGVAHMLASVVEKSIAEMSERLNEQPMVLLTGGASDRIAPLLQAHYRDVPDLVLQGLAVLAHD